MRHGSVPLWICSSINGVKTLFKNKEYYLGCMLYTQFYDFKFYLTSAYCSRVHLQTMDDQSPKGCAVALVGDKCEVHLHIKVFGVFYFLS